MNRLEGSFGYLDETRGYVELVSHSFYIIILRRYFGSKNARCLHVFPENYIKIGGGGCPLHPSKWKRWSMILLLSSQGGACYRGRACSGRGGLVVSEHALRQTPPPLWTDRCKNITFATSLRTVISWSHGKYLFQTSTMQQLNIKFAFNFV